MNDYQRWQIADAEEEQNTSLHVYFTPLSFAISIHGVILSFILVCTEQIRNIFSSYFPECLGGEQKSLEIIGEFLLVCSSTQDRYAYSVTAGGWCNRFNIYCRWWQSKPFPLLCILTLNTENSNIQRFTITFGQQFAAQVNNTLHTALQTSVK